MSSFLCFLCLLPVIHPIFFSLLLPLSASLTLPFLSPIFSSSLSLSLLRALPFLYSPSLSPLLPILSLSFYYFFPLTSYHSPLFYLTFRLLYISPILRFTPSLSLFSFSIPNPCSLSSFQLLLFLLPPLYTYLISSKLAHPPPYLLYFIPI